MCGGGRIDGAEEIIVLYRSVNWCVCQNRDCRNIKGEREHWPSSFGVVHGGLRLNVYALP